MSKRLLKFLFRFFNTESLKGKGLVSKFKPAGRTKKTYFAKQTYAAKDDGFLSN